MQELLTRLGRALDRNPVDAGLVARDGAVEMTPAVDGRRVDAVALASRLKHLLLSLNATSLEVPFVPAVPQVRPEDDRAALEQPP